MALLDFRAHQSTAPLKRIGVTGVSTTGVGFPCSSEHGPIEALSEATTPGP